jgi:hypothetical protein
MKTYVAGTVLRSNLKPSVYERLEYLYRSIEHAAKRHAHTAELPYPDHNLDQMEANAFRREIRRRIEEADSVIAILDPPNEAVGIEAHIAEEAGKPQAILVQDVAQPPQAIQGLERCVLYAATDPPLEKIFKDLAEAVAWTSRPSPPKSDPSKGTAVKFTSAQFYDTQVTTVDYQILFTKWNREALLDCGSVLVTSAMTGHGFVAWQICLFIQKLNRGIPKPKDWTDAEAMELAAEVLSDPDPAAIEFSAAAAKDAVWPRIKTVIGLKPENLKYLQVDYQIISTFNRKPPSYDADQVDALREIATAIKSKCS